MKSHFRWLFPLKCTTGTFIPFSSHRLIWLKKHDWWLAMNSWIERRKCYWKEWLDDLIVEWKIFLARGRAISESHARFSSKVVPALGAQSSDFAFHLDFWAEWRNNDGGLEVMDCFLIESCIGALWFEKLFVVFGMSEVENPSGNVQYFSPPLFTYLLNSTINDSTEY